MNDSTSLDSIFFFKTQSANTENINAWLPKAKKSEVFLRESFIGSKIQSENMQAQQINQYQGFNWPIAVLVLILLFFSVSQLIYSRNQKLVFKSFFNISEFQNYLNNFSIIRNPYIVSLLIIGLINFSLLIALFTVNNNINFMESGYLISLKIFLIFAAFILFKYALLLFAGKIFSDKSIGTMYLSFETLSFSVIGIALYPLLWALVIETNEILFSASLILLALILLVKIINLSQLLLKKSNFYLFQIILYLCSLEILPVLLLVKFVNQGFNL